MPAPNVFEEALHITRADTSYHRKGWHHAVAQLISDHCTKKATLSEPYISAFEHAPSTRMKKDFFIQNGTSVCAAVSPDNVLLVDPESKSILLIARRIGTTDDMPDSHFSQWHDPLAKNYAQLTSYLRTASHELLQKMGVPIEQAPEQNQPHQTPVNRLLSPRHRWHK